MKKIFSVKTVVGFVSAAAITGTMLAGFDQASAKVPTQWPISINATGQAAQKFS